MKRLISTLSDEVFFLSHGFRPRRLREQFIIHSFIVFHSILFVVKIRMKEDVTSMSSKKSTPSKNDQKSNQSNPNNPAHQSGQDNRSNQMNPNHSDSKSSK